MRIIEMDIHVSNNVKKVSGMAIVNEDGRTGKELVRHSTWKETSLLYNIMFNYNFKYIIKIESDVNIKYQIIYQHIYVTIIEH